MKFTKEIRYLKNFDEDERDMTKYVIGAISNLDTPRTPRTKEPRPLQHILLEQARKI